MNKEPAQNQLTKNQSQSLHMAISGVVILLGIIIVFFLNNRNNTPDEVDTTATTINAELMVPAQVATDSVHIDQVTLPQAGFLAVRAIDNDRLGQIIEISQYLTAGTHDDITITLGDFYDGGEELIVMAYEDTGDDKTFNDLDQTLIVNGVPLSMYVRSGAPVPVSIVTNMGNTATMHTMGNSAIVTVRYTDMGFAPKELSVPLGATVHFVNESEKEMWVASNEHPGHSILPTFDQFQTGDQYMYVFDKIGSWAYHDHLNPTAEGVITVEAK